MLLSISGASEPLCVGGFWESWVHSVDRRGCVDWDRGGGINEGRGAGGKTGKGGEDGDGWVGEYVRARGDAADVVVCGLKSHQIPASWQAVYFQIYYCHLQILYSVQHSLSSFEHRLSAFLFTNLNLRKHLKQLPKSDSNKGDWTRVAAKTFKSISNVRLK